MSPSGDNARDDAGGDADQQEVIVYLDPAMATRRCGKAMTAIVAHLTHIAALGGRHAMALVPAMLLDALLFDDLLLYMPLDLPMAVGAAMIIACLRHRRGEDGGGKHNGNELFHRSLQVLFTRRTLG